MSKREPLTRRPEKAARRSIFQRIMGWSRLARIGLVFVGAMALAMLLLPVVDQLFFRVGGVFIGQSSGPTWVVMIFCFGLYFSGYVLMIGTPGTPPEDSRAQRIYIGLVLFIIAITVVWYTLMVFSIANGA